MTKKSQFNGFGDTEFQIEPYEFNPNVSSDIQQTLSKVSGFNESNRIWKGLRVDPDGRLYVSSSPTQTNDAVNSAASVTTTSTLLLSENPDRRQYIIQNLGSSDIYLMFDTIAVAAQGIKIPSDGLFGDDVYQGAISAICLTGTADVRIVEM